MTDKHGSQERGHTKAAQFYSEKPRERKIEEPGELPEPRKQDYQEGGYGQGEKPGATI